MILQYIITIITLAVISTVAVANAQSYTGVLDLNPISSTITTGNTVVFSGQLSTTSGHVVRDATIYIKDDVDFGRDDIIKKVTTNTNGEFYTTWIAKPRSEGKWDFYAVFEGLDNISKARSHTYSVNVQRYSSGPTYYSTSITLHKIPSSIYAGDTVTFTGELLTNGRPLSNALVKIMEDDPFLPDQRIGSDRTDTSGRFSVTWNVSAGLVEDDFDIYAVFDGDSNYKRARSYNQVMSVLKYGGSITLDPIPNSARAGSVVIFSGTLNLNQYSSEGAVVYIKDEDPITGDDLLATGYVDGYGKFTANWFASYVDEDEVADIYAVFEGNDVLYRLTTCDKGPTRSFGGSCSYTKSLRILDPVPTPPSSYIPTDNQYMELYYALNFSKKPHVAIVPSPDSYNEVRGHIVPVQEGIRMWENNLERQYGGYWDVSFEVIPPGKLFYDSKPDVIVNLVTRDDDASCFKDYSGVAYTTAIKPIQTYVCSTSDDQRISNASIASTAAHEFIHAVGLGHTFNKKGDMMCSVEDGRATCSGLSSKSKTPSDLNLAAVVQIYGNDGFSNPNNYIMYEERFFLNDHYNDPNNNPTTRKPISSCTHTDYTYNYDVDIPLKPGWYQPYKICSSNISYSFSTDNSYHGFMIFVLPPETNVKNFMDAREGNYYVCEEYEQEWHRQSNTCNIEPGSHIVLHNIEENTIRIDGWIRN